MRWEMAIEAESQIDAELFARYAAKGLKGGESFCPEDYRLESKRDPDGKRLCDRHYSITNSDREECVDCWEYAILHALKLQKQEGGAI